VVGARGCVRVAQESKKRHQQPHRRENNNSTYTRTQTHREIKMSGARNRQQRLFTGALFPEELNAQLFRFAERHKLQSNVWVPRRAFEMALRPYNIFMLPSAAFCDVSLAPGGGLSDVVVAIGVDRVLVNAQHTSDQKFMEEFRVFLTSRLTTPARLPTWADTPIFSTATELSTAGQADAIQPCDKDAAALLTRNGPNETAGDRELFSAADKQVAAEAQSRKGLLRLQQPTLICQPDPLWDRLPPFQHPLALNGSLLLGTEVSTRLLDWQRRQHSFSNYWRCLRSVSTQLQVFSNASATEYPGRYNPFFCVRYVPHNYTGRSFPMDISRLMRHRAVEYGYVSRLWLTERQGEELFGTTLHPERAHHFPTVFTSYHTGGLECLAYYCADQFVNGEELFPTEREILLAAKGVLISPTKVAAFPLLLHLQKKYATEPSSCDSCNRSGVDVSRQDSSRHAEFCQLTEAFSTIRLVGFSEKKTASYMSESHIGSSLRRQCILCGYPTATFISHRTLVQLCLPLRDGEEGVVQTRHPVQLPFSNAFASGECWFNVAQLREPAVGVELKERWPRHFLTRRHFHSHVAVQCCRVQIAERARAMCPVAGAVSSTTAPPLNSADTSSSEWVPLFVLQLMGWRLREGAAGVRYRPRGANENLSWFGKGASILFRIEDVCIDAQTVEWLRRYTPVNSEGYPYLRGLRQLMVLRAYERAYESHVWFAFSESDAASLPRKLRAKPRPVCPGVTPLNPSVWAFSNPPFVRFRRLMFANQDELESGTFGAEHGGGESDDSEARGRARQEAGDSLPRMSDDLRRMVESGIGVSAEALVKSTAPSVWRREDRMTGVCGGEGSRAASAHENCDHDALQTSDDTFLDDEDVGDLPYEDDDSEAGMKVG
jgi:hypothetical protein